MDGDWQTVPKRGTAPEDLTHLSHLYRVRVVKTKASDISQCRRLVLSWARDETTMIKSNPKRRNIITHALEKGGALEEWYLCDPKELRGKVTLEEVPRADALLWVRQLGLVREHYYYLNKADRIPFVTALVKEFGLPLESSEQDLVQKIARDLGSVIDLNLAKITNQTRNDVVYNLSQELKDEINDTHFENEKTLLEFMKRRVPDWDVAYEQFKVDRIKNKADGVETQTDDGKQAAAYGLEDLGQLLHILHVTRFKIRLTTNKDGSQWLVDHVISCAQKCQEDCPTLGRMLAIASTTSPRPGYIFAGSISKSDAKKDLKLTEYSVNKNYPFAHLSDKGRCFVLELALDVGPSLKIGAKEQSLEQKVEKLAIIEATAEENESYKE